MTTLPRWRIAAIFAVLLVLLGGLALKSARLQLVLGDDLRGLAENQYLRKLQIAAPRGRILDREMRALAVSVPAWSVSARPGLVEDKLGAAAALAPVLGMTTNEVATKLAGERFVWLKRRASLDVAEGVRALSIPGIELKQELRRTWPNKTAAGQLLGLVDVDGKARGGIEQALDEELQGRSAKAPVLADNRGDRIAIGGGIDLDLLAGDDVVLTLDLALQHEAENAVASVLAEHHAKAAWALVLDAQTAAVLAVAHAPAFNPNAPDPATSRNRAFGDAFEPGSIFKIASFAAALDAGVVDGNDRIFCENGRYQLGKHFIHDTHKAEWLTAAEVFQQSSNIGTLKIAQRLGEEKLRAALERFGFGAKVGVGVVEDNAGRMPAGNRWGDARLATVSFGHGMLVTSLQMASLVQAVANDGVRKQPYLVDRVLSSTGDVVRANNPDLDPGERLMSSEAARALHNMMITVAVDGGTGTLAAIPGIEVAGKTGTAEKVDPVTKRYSKDLNISSFAGYAPANDPRVVAIVVVDEPREQHFGGTVAAPAWRRIVERALVEKGVLAQGTLAASAAKARAKPREEGAHIVDVADVTKRERAAASPTADASGMKARELTPDYRGLTARAALRKAEADDVELAITGTGLVVAQEPSPGAKLRENGRVRLTLASPDAVIARVDATKGAH